MLCLGACAATPRRADTDPVSLGDWCQRIGQATCGAMADKCFGGMSGFAGGCRDSFGPGCLAGRAASDPSGRSFGELSRCLQSLAALSCEGLGASVGSGSYGALCAAAPR